MKKLSNELEKLNNQINGVCLYKHLRSNKKMNIKQKRERETEEYRHDPEEAVFTFYRYKLWSAEEP